MLRNSKPFYEDVFGWKIIQAQDPSNTGLSKPFPSTQKARRNGSASTAVCTKNRQPENKPINYFAVESISDFLEKIEKAGGKVIQPKEEVPEVGWIAAAQDPEGNQFALIEPLAHS